MNRLIALALVLFASGTLSACKMAACQPGAAACGTGTGNPAQESQVAIGTDSSLVGGIGAGNSTSQTPATEILLAGLCAKINQCAPEISLTQCRAGIQDLSDLHPEIGIAPNAVDSYGEAILTEMNGVIHPNRAQLATCVAEVERISCSDARVTEIKTSLAVPFEKVKALLPVACKTVF